MIYTTDKFLFSIALSFQLFSIFYFLCINYNIFMFLLNMISFIIFLYVFISLCGECITLQKYINIIIKENINIIKNINKKLGALI